MRLAPAWRSPTRSTLTPIVNATVAWDCVQVQMSARRPFCFLQKIRS